MQHRLGLPCPSAGAQCDFYPPPPSTLVLLTGTQEYGVLQLGFISLDTMNREQQKPSTAYKETGKKQKDTPRDLSVSPLSCLRS